MIPGDEKGRLTLRLEVLMEGEAGLRETTASSVEQFGKGLGGKERRSLFEVYRDIGEASFLASRIRDSESAREVERVISRFEQVQSSHGATLDSELVGEAEDVLGRYNEWLKVFEELLTEPVSFPDHEIDFDRRLLYLRDCIEYASSGLQMVGARAGGREGLLRVREADSRLESVIRRFCPHLFREFPNYSVMLPGEFPDGFWWRYLVWELRDRASSREA